MQAVDAYNNILLCTLYTKILDLLLFLYVYFLCDVRVYVYTHFEFFGSNTSKYNWIIIFILHCGVSRKQTLP
jgi:hypothetical protein